MYQEPKFDENQFAGRRAKAVHATKTADDWESTGISFHDLGGMHIQHRKVCHVRRLKTPGWAMNDEQTSAVVLRLSVDGIAVRERTGTDQVRIACIGTKSQAGLPAK